MRTLLTYLVVALLGAGMLAAGCAQSAPAPSPTQSPAAQPAAAPTKAASAAPTAAPAAPTAVPAPKVSFPEKGKTITWIVPLAAGGGTDVTGRAIAAVMEKDLGTSIQFVNKPGGSSQTGMTELSLAKPDGYTIGSVSLTTFMPTYLDAQRKATYSHKSFQAVSLLSIDTYALNVRSESPYKTAKDLIDAAKANPGKITHGASGLLSGPHMNAIQLQGVAGVEFAGVHFDGDAPTMTALMGGHVESSTTGAVNVLPNVRSGALRALGTYTEQQSELFPGVQSLAAQGYKATLGSPLAMFAPAGTPPEVVEILNKSVKKALEDPQISSTFLRTFGMKTAYMTPAATASFWDEQEKIVKPMVEAEAAKRK